MKKYLKKCMIEFTPIEIIQLFPMEPSEFEISLSVESLDKKIAKNCTNDYVVEERINFQIIKNIDPKY